MTCMHCLGNEIKTIPILTESFDNGKSPSRKNVKYCRIDPEAPGAVQAAIIRCHLGNEIPGYGDISNPTYIMGPRDHFFEVIRLVVKELKTAESFPTRSDLVDKVHEKQQKLWRAVRPTTEDEVRYIVDQMVDALTSVI